MIAKGKKINSGGKGKKKITAPAKARSKPKIKDDVCVLDDVIVTEQLYCCDDECCCLI